MAKIELEDRTKIFALAIIDLVERMPRNRASDVAGRQLLRSGTSIGANSRPSRDIIVAGRQGITREWWEPGGCGLTVGFAGETRFFCQALRYNNK